MSWDQRFFDPITVPGREPLVTLRDAAEYITELPKAEHDTDEWQAAMEALLLVAELDGPPMFARIGVMRALNRGPEESTVPRRLGGSGTVQATHHCGNVTQKAWNKLSKPSLGAKHHEQLQNNALPNSAAQPARANLICASHSSP